VTDPSTAPTARGVFATLLLVAVLAPLGFARPGLPGAFKGDEPGYYLMALSLWRDHDARAEEDRDLPRLFVEAPERTHNLWLVSPDGFETVYFGVPFLYPLIAAPAAGLFGARGMISLNAALFVALLWMGWSYLRRFNTDARAALYAAAFFLLSPALVYVFWLQGELLHMACVAGAFYLQLRRGDDEPAGPLALAGSGALLACAAYSRPTVALLGIPLLWIVVRRARVRGAAFWCGGVLAAMVVLAGVSTALVEEPWVYAGLSRKPFDISSPIHFLQRMEPAAATWQTHAEPWSLGHIREIVVPWRARWSRMPREALYFFVGRHVGLFAYMPFAAISSLLFLLRGPRERWRFLLLACALAAGLLWVVYLPGNWRGGGPSFGNRIFATAYPAFLFLVTAIRPFWAVPAGTAVASFLLGGGVLTALSPPGGDPTAQRHTLGAAFRALPREFELSGITGYVHLFHSDASFSGHYDLLLPAGDEMWVRGGVPVELLMLTREPIRDAVFRVRSLAPGNEVELCLEGSCQSMETASDTPAGGQRFEVTLEAAHPRRLARSDQSEYLYELTVRTSAGEQPRWRLSSPAHFYLGAALTYLGSSDEKAREMYGARWSEVGVPEVVAAGAEFVVSARLQNVSAEGWMPMGATRVAASYHWEDGGGGRVAWDGVRTPLPATVTPGQAIPLQLRVRAPASPGRYVLVLDVVRENITWFSTRDPQAAHRSVVEVEAAPAVGG